MAINPGRWLRARNAVAAAALAALGVAAPMPASGETPSPQAAPPLPVSVQLLDLQPIAPQQHDVIRITGMLRNVSTTTVTDLGLQLRYNPTHIRTRSEFDNYGFPRNPDGSPAGPLPLPPATAAAAVGTMAAKTLAPGAAEQFRLTVPVDSLSLDQPWQVFELAVQVLSGYNTVGGLRTYLPWAPKRPGTGFATQVAWIWPLVDQPHRSVGATFVDDSLARSFAPGGRLARLLDAGTAAIDQQPAATPPSTPAKSKKAKKQQTVVPLPVSSVPLTWAVDPMVVEDASLMAGGYKVAGQRGAVNGTGSAAARAWLDKLRAAVAKTGVVALPYADPDVVAATRHQLQDQVQVAINSGQSLLARLLGTTPFNYSWAPDGLLDQRTLDTLFSAGVSTVVLDDRALPPVIAPNLTPSAHTTIRASDANLDALLTDNVLDGVVDAGVQDPSAQRLALQRFLSETLMIQAEQPFTQRTIVVAPDRRWDPSSSYAAALASDTGKVPWIHPVPLSAVIATPEAPPLVRSGLKYLPAARAAELSGDYLFEVRKLSTEADEFASILSPGDPAARALDDALLRSLSSAWRSDPAGASRFRTDVSTTLARTKNKVHIASAQGSFVTLTSHSGTVPVTVANDLDTPVRIAVEISSQHLQVSGGGRVTQIIPAHRQIAVDVRASTKTSGVFRLDVSLWTPSPNEQVYDQTYLYVRSTAYGTVAILITAGATGVLLIAVIFRLIRRALAARRAPAAAA